MGEIKYKITVSCKENNQQLVVECINYKFDSTMLYIQTTEDKKIVTIFPLLNIQIIEVKDLS